MTNTTKTFDGKPISYEIVTDGYKIYLDEKLWIEQVGQYSKPIDSSKTFEENCLAQIDEITTVSQQEETIEQRVTQTESDITDIQVAMAELYEMEG